MIIITGTFRSGTSLMMNCVGNLIGFENIVGEKFPSTQKSLHRFRISARTLQPDGSFQESVSTQTQENKQEPRDMTKYNPLGFWEDYRYLMQGFGYREEGGLDQFNALANNSKRFVKILGRGLTNTHPQYVDKVIICLRNPYDLATSQKLLLDKTKMPPSPRAQITDYMDICQYLSTYPEIPYLVVDYEQQKKGNVAMERLARFLEVPVADSPYDASISKNTDNPRPYEGEDWDHAVKLQEHIRKGEFTLALRSRHTGKRIKDA